MGNKKNTVDKAVFLAARNLELLALCKLGLHTEIYNDLYDKVKRKFTILLQNLIS